MTLYEILNVAASKALTCSYMRSRHLGVLHVGGSVDEQATSAHNREVIVNGGL